MLRLRQATAALFFLCIVGTTVAVAQPYSMVKPESVGMSSERLARIDAHMDAVVEEGTVPGAVALVLRHGQIVYSASFGEADREASKPMSEDAIFRIASMTKPITSVAVMMLYEKGHFLLRDPVSRYIPAFEDPEVLVELDEADTTYTTEPARREITIRDLLTHTSGIAYGGFHEQFGPIYAKAGVPDGFVTRDIELDDTIPVLAGLPLAHHPGERFTYGLNTDVLGYLVEVVSGVPLDQFLHDNIFEPLGMEDTYFHLPEHKAERLAQLYTWRDERFERVRPVGDLAYSAADYPIAGARSYFSGGAGLVSTAADYARFARMLLNGGSLDGVRLLSPKTVELMTTDHVPGDIDFGLGFGVITDLGRSGELGSVGAYSWSGYWNTLFWIDPMENLIGIWMGQTQPSPYRFDRFRTLVYQAITETGGHARDHSPLR